MKYKTDLAIEVNTYHNDVISAKVKITKQNITSYYAKKHGFLKGVYTTLEFNKINRHLKNSLKSVLSSYLTQFEKILVVGLGNKEFVADKIGPLTINKCEYRSSKKIYFFEVGVLGNTGLESADVVKSLVMMLNPDVVITIDALVASNSSRLLRTIQVTNAGVKPGSGLLNKRKYITKQYLKVPVVSIGIPTAINTAIIVEEVILFMQEHKGLKKFNLYDLEREQIKELVQGVTEALDNNMMVILKDTDNFNEKISTMLSRILMHIR